MERFGTPPVPCPDVRPAGDELPCHLWVVAERRSMERRVAFVDLCQALGHEELVASGPHVPSPTTASRRAERHGSSVVARRDRYHQAGDVAHVRRLSLMEAVRTIRGCGTDELIGLGRSQPGWAKGPAVEGETPMTLPKIVY